MGILDGLKIIEMAGIGPAPFTGMLLADHGAEVIKIERPNPGIAALIPRETDVLARGRKSIIIDIKSDEGLRVIRDLCRDADGFIEGLRPGAMERHGLGPEDLQGINPKLVYGRVTGWGQDGPLSQVAGHDINYLALSGSLHTYGRQGERPTPPINLAADFAGGAMFLAFGMMAAIMKARETGKGQVVDCAMTDGSALLAGLTWSSFNAGFWSEERGTNFLDTGAHFYDTYETSDGRWISLGAIEPHFYAKFRTLVGLEDDPEFDDQLNPAAWPSLKQKLDEIFKTRTRDEWCDLLEGEEVCFAPVLSMSEAPMHAHNKARSTFAKIGSQWQPMPAPRFSDEQTKDIAAPSQAGLHTHDILSVLGYSSDKIENLINSGVVKTASPNN